VLRPGEYADVLRAIGWTLDRRLAEGEAAHVEIVVRGSGIVVCWQSSASPVERQAYGVADLEMLCERARALRDTTGTRPAGGQTELLRTIGQHLDEYGITLERLLRAPEGHRLTGVLNWRSLGHWYAPDDVREMSEARRRLRGTQA